jgi:plastocyanin
MDDDSASVDIPAGSTKTVTLNITGSASFHCHFHPTMKGTITVGGAAVTVPTSSSTGTTPRY